MSHEWIAILMFSTMLLMMITGQRVFGAIGFVAVLLGAANAAGGYVVTERMLAMFKSKEKK